MPVSSIGSSYMTLLINNNIDYNENTSPVEYLNDLAVKLKSAPDPIKALADFIDKNYKYTLNNDNEKFQTNFFGILCKDEYWQSPEEFTKARFRGDCEDIALFAQKMTSALGKKSFMIILPCHAITAWVETNEPYSTAYLSDCGLMGKKVSFSSIAGFASSTSVKGSNIASICGKEGESPAAVLVRLMKKSGYSFDPRNFMIGFLIADGKNEPISFVVRGDLELAERYSEISALLNKHDYQSLFRILQEAAARNPGNIDLSMTLINMLLLSRTSSLDIKSITGSVVSNMFSLESISFDLIDNINNTAYSLTKSGYAKEAILLLESLIKSVREHPDRSYASGIKLDTMLLSLNDSLADMYVANGEYGKALEIDKTIEASLNGLMKEYKNNSDYKKWFAATVNTNGQDPKQIYSGTILARLTNNVGYKRYVSTAK